MVSQLHLSSFSKRKQIWLKIPAIFLMTLVLFSELSTSRKRGVLLLEFDKHFYFRHSLLWRMKLKFKETENVLMQMIQCGEKKCFCSSSRLRISSNFVWNIPVILCEGIFKRLCGSPRKKKYCSENELFKFEIDQLFFLKPNAVRDARWLAENRQQAKLPHSPSPCCELGRFPKWRWFYF